MNIIASNKLYLCFVPAWTHQLRCPSRNTLEMVERWTSDFSGDIELLYDCDMIRRCSESRCTTIYHRGDREEVTSIVGDI